MTPTTLGRPLLILLNLFKSKSQSKVELGAGAGGGGGVSVCVCNAVLNTPRIGSVENGRTHTLESETNLNPAT